MTHTNFNYIDERFADLQMLRYRLTDFEQLTTQQKELIFYLSKATLYGRDIIFDQFGRHHLRIRKTLEAVYTAPDINHESADFKELELYLKRMWFSNGIYHHYGCEKFKPGFSEAYFREIVGRANRLHLPLHDGETVNQLLDEVCPVIFDEQMLPKRVNKSDGDDLVVTSACNYYENVTQQEAESYYRNKKAQAGDHSPSYGLNSRLVKKDGKLQEEIWCENGKYSNAIKQIIYWLNKAAEVAENKKQKGVIQKLISYYQNGDLRTFDQYSIAWVESVEGRVDFVNGFIEVYGDPLGLKGSWEGIVEYKDIIATKRAQTISHNAQWFEDHSPVDARFRKKQVKGVTANVVCAAMLGGDEYPSTAIGINLPNADWIRAEYGSKSVTISNLIEAYNNAAKGNGFYEEFVVDEETCRMIELYGDVCDDLHTDLHECLGHGSGQLLPGVDPDALKAYGNTIEEARADLFALYYLADEKIVELELLSDRNAYKSQYYTYMMNGLMTQLIRIELGHQIEEAHMRNRSLIAHWCQAHGDAVKIVKRNGKSYVEITDYRQLRRLIAALLAEIQRIKSEGDFEAARNLVEQYAVCIDQDLHKEVLERYHKLNLAPYKGFINPHLLPVVGQDGRIKDVQVDYTESYAQQMLRYSTEYATLI